MRVMRFSVKGLLGAAVMALSAATQGARAQTPSYPDTWEVYVAERDGAPAAIAYSVGIAEVLDGLEEQTVVVLSITLQDTYPNGLPTTEEGDRLSSLDVQLDRIVAGQKSFYLGRVTTRGERRIYVLSGTSASSLGDALVAAAAEVGYSASFVVQHDPDRQAYRAVLSPSEDERRLIGDQSLLRQLRDAGDNPAATRPVDHWAYFVTEGAASVFADWAKQHDFRDVEVTETGDAVYPFLVRSSHDGTMLEDDILPKTRQQDQSARALGGAYDGWETQVMAQIE
jgi:Regulator of ribonuclease activity B/Family of unknown function (DUF695)